MKSRTLSIALFLLLATNVFAGGRLEQIDITANTPTPIPGHVVGKIVGIFWDARSIPVKYSMNNTLNPIPNPLGPAFLTVAQAQAAIQNSLNEWNNLPTSYIDMQITGTTGNLGLRGFDMINEVTFRTANNFGAIASSPSTSLIADVTLVDGDFIDNDADPDVSSAITVAADVDGDGDIEFPAGFYKAGTILDNDVQFNTKASNGLRFTVGDAAIDAVTRSVDINTVATHEFGHSFGLSHSMDNQISATDGDGATMFPFIDTGDPVAELQQRSLSADDIAWASYLYPEGSGSGIAALQAGDVAFDKVYGLITGEIRHGVLNQPVAGASVSASNWATGNLVSSGYSGTTQVSVSPTGGLSVISAAFNILDGKYTIPVAKGSYSVGVEAVDGTPAAAANISLNCQIGTILGQMNFNEEFYNNNSEGGVELRPGQRKSVPIQAGREQAGVNITTGRTFNINNFGALQSIGFINSPAGRTYAVRVPAAQVQAIINSVGDDILIQGVGYNTHVLDASVVPVYARALLTTGTLDATGNLATIDLTTPLQETFGFVGQDGDFANFYFQEPQELGRIVRAGIASGAIQNLFMVIQIPTTLPFPGVSAQAPLVGLTAAAPFQGMSFLSNNGASPFTRIATFDFHITLIASEPVN